MVIVGLIVKVIAVPVALVVLAIVAADVAADVAEIAISDVGRVVVGTALVMVVNTRYYTVF
jgi:hypothetical protein